MALNRLVKDLGVVVGVGLIWLEAAAAAPAVVIAAPSAATVVVDRPVRKPALKTRNFAISHLK